MDVYARRVHARLLPAVHVYLALHRSERVPAGPPPETKTKSQNKTFVPSRSAQGTALRLQFTVRAGAGRT